MAYTKKKKHKVGKRRNNGGPRENSGAPKKPESELKTITLRVTEAEKEFISRLRDAKKDFKEIV